MVTRGSADAQQGGDRIRGRGRTSDHAPRDRRCARAAACDPRPPRPRQGECGQPGAGDVTAGGAARGRCPRGHVGGGDLLVAARDGESELTGPDRPCGRRGRLDHPPQARRGGGEGLRPLVSVVVHRHEQPVDHPGRGGRAAPDHGTAQRERRGAGAGVRRALSPRERLHCRAEGHCEHGRHRTPHRDCGCEVNSPHGPRRRGRGCARIRGGGARRVSARRRQSRPDRGHGGHCSSGAAAQQWAGRRPSVCRLGARSPRARQRQCGDGHCGRGCHLAAGQPARGLLWRQGTGGGGGRALRPRRQRRQPTRAHGGRWHRASCAATRHEQHARTQPCRGRSRA